MKDQIELLRPFGLAFALLAFFTQAQAVQNAKPAKAKKASSRSASENTGTLNDSWYTMQAGSTPFGIFHERIQVHDGRYSYKYALTKYERGLVYQENIGALAEQDLTPVAFNLNKSGSGATESTNATYARSQTGGIFKLEIQGARTANLERHVSRGTILDVFFPLYLSRNWPKFRTGYQGWLNTFSEDPEQREFRSREVHFEIRGMDPEDACMKIHVEMDVVRGEWCMTQQGVLVDLKVGSFHVRRARSEQEAQAFIAGLAAKAQKKE